MLAGSVVIGGLVWGVVPAEALSASEPAALGRVNTAAAGQTDGATVQPSFDFHWKSGDRYSVRWQAQHRLVNTEYVVQLEGGEPQASPVQARLETKEVRHWNDWIQSVGESRPLRLRRSWSKALWNGELRLEGTSSDILKAELSTPLTGPEVTVQFTATPAAAQASPNDPRRLYGLHYDRNAPPEAALAGLNFGLDLAAWRPPLSGRKGDKTEWTVPVSALRVLMAPGGNLAYERDAEDNHILARSMELGFGGGWDELLSGPELRGEVIAHIERTVEAAAGREVHVRFHFNGSNRIDRREQALRLRRIPERVAGLTFEKAEIDMRWGGKGRVIWDPDIGRMRSFDLTGSLDMSLLLRIQATDQPRRTERTNYRGNFDVEASLQLSAPGAEPAPWTERIEVSDPGEPK